MADTRRPLSPHLQIYKWQVQMVSSILHRATGIALAVGTLLVLWGLLALAAGESHFDQFKACIGSPVGIILLIGWSWSLFYHLCNGIRHLVQDTGAGYAIPKFVRSSWLSLIASIVLVVIVWAWVLSTGGAA
ncbi:succinate dehydrogenase, cytochrome b556 subunit [Rhodanobacter glycinis]|uniref:Succinate dehydrogenase cytochrome b556 subunit n=1 Tax=Rhodanobacter glycinis TaxID=582702 RepID=A0A1I3XZC4_9GAMM|nr:succinate dehydrogenase, cytochrome b556 subunit [Rhodanobacter glycinis]QEE24622.1 succinate dehydrogenase, cytochrome b556 subunit [Rhodanobacter glycinis]SFK24924.1 succinate dehydrogenase subunit C [Rhodanobacter glycinis]